MEKKDVIIMVVALEIFGEHGITSFQNQERSVGYAGDGGKEKK